MITRQEVQKMASLARLNLDDSEVEQYQKDMEQMLNYVQQFLEVKTSDVEPKIQAAIGSNMFREDKVEISLPVEKALENAPERAGNYFKVPQVIDH